MLVVNPDSPNYELGRMPCNLRHSFKDLQLGKITTFRFRNIIEETFPQYRLVIESVVPINGGIEHHMIFSPKSGKHRLAVFNFGRKTINGQVKFYYHNLRIPEYNDLVRSLKIFSNIIINLEPSFTLEQAYYISTLFIHQPNIKIDHLKYYLKAYKQNVA